MLSFQFAISESQDRLILVQSKHELQHSKISKSYFFLYIDQITTDESIWDMLQIGF